MSQELWTRVDRYISELIVPSEPGIAGSLQACADAGLPAISVSPPQAAMLMILARSIGARRILEVGTLGGYSTMWLAKALPPGGKVITLEIDPNHAGVARANFERAGMADRIELRLGNALDSLPILAKDMDKPFDFVFIDADKQSIPEYFEWSLKLTRPGGLIVVDNVIRSGAVVDAGSSDGRVQGVRRFNEMVSKESRVYATTIQSVGQKGYDGFSLLLLK